MFIILFPLIPANLIINNHLTTLKKSKFKGLIMGLLHKSWLKIKILLKLVTFAGNNNYLKVEKEVRYKLGSTAFSKSLNKTSVCFRD